MALTAMQAAFVEAYTHCRNATAAARTAGYSPNGITVAASKLLKTPAVKAAIEDAFAAHAMAPNEALANLAEIARGEWGEYIDVDDSGRILRFDFRQLKADGKCHLIQHISQERNGIRATFPSRLDALKLILQGLGMLGNTASEGDIAHFIERFGKKETTE